LLPRSENNRVTCDNLLLSRTFGLPRLYLAVFDEIVADLNTLDPHIVEDLPMVDVNNEDAAFICHQDEVLVGVERHHDPLDVVAEALDQRVQLKALKELAISAENEDHVLRVVHLDSHDFGLYHKRYKIVSKKKVLPIGPPFLA
jgi:hypothetical protein